MKSLNILGDFLRKVLGCDTGRVLPISSVLAIN